MSAPVERKPKPQSFAAWLSATLREKDMPEVADYIDAGTEKRKRDASARSKGRAAKRARG